MDAGSLAAILTAVGSLVLGAIGLVHGSRRDTSAAETTAKSVATDAAEAAVGALKAGLDFLTGEVAALRQQVVECETEKAALSLRVRELERAG